MFSKKISLFLVLAVSSFYKSECRTLDKYVIPSSRRVGIDVDRCFCFTNPGTFSKVPEILQPQGGDRLERLVIYLYKDKQNGVKMYIPNREKQNLVPDLAFEVGDKLVQVENKTSIHDVIDQYSRSFDGPEMEHEYSQDELEVPLGLDELPTPERKQSQITPVQANKEVLGDIIGNVVTSTESPHATHQPGRYNNYKIYTLQNEKENGQNFYFKIPNKKGVVHPLNVNDQVVTPIHIQGEATNGPNVIQQIFHDKYMVYPPQDKSQGKLINPVNEYGQNIYFDIPNEKGVVYPIKVNHHIVTPAVTKNQIVIQHLEQPTSHVVYQQFRKNIELINDVTEEVNVTKEHDVTFEVDVTEEHDVTKEYDVTFEVDVTKEYDVSFEVDGTIEHDVTEEVDGNKDHDVTFEVDVTKEHDVTEEVDVTKEHDVTEEVDVTEEHDVTFEVVGTIEHDVTEEVDVTKEHDVTFEVDVTKEYDVTFEVDGTIEHDVTEEVDVTKEHDVTFEVDVTKEYDVTFEVDGTIAHDDTEEVDVIVEHDFIKEVDVNQSDSVEFDVLTDNINAMKPNNINHYETFDRWFLREMYRFKSYKAHDSAVDMSTIELYILKILQDNNMFVTSEGVLTDLNGTVLDVRHLNLRPVLIGNSVTIEKVLNEKDQELVLPMDLPYLQALLVTNSKPSMILGIIPIGKTIIPPSALNAFSTILKKSSVLPRKVNNIKTTKSRVDYKLLPGLLKESEPIVMQLSGSKLPIMGDKKNAHTVLTVVKKIPMRVPGKPRPSETMKVYDSNSHEIELGDEALNAVKKLMEAFKANDGHLLKSSDDEVHLSDDDIAGRIIGGNAATSSGTPLNVKGRMKDFTIKSDSNNFITV